jgi:predicted DNA-binding ribbon-helix-helix protein
MKKRSIVIRNRRTSFSLEDEFWLALKGIAEIRQTSRSMLVALIEGQGRTGNLSSAIRVFVIEYYIARSAQPTRGKAAEPGAAALISMSPQLTPWRVQYFTNNGRQR